MFRHILTIIWNNRRHNGWLIAGLFVMSTCMWYAVDYVYTVTVNQTRPLGFDTVCLFIIAQKGIAGKTNTQIFLFPKNPIFGMKMPSCSVKWADATPKTI